MGSGAFGSNGSVHWELAYERNPGDPVLHRDNDDIPYDQIGNEKGNPGKFLLRLRFPSPSEARSAFEEALRGVDATGGGNTTVYITLKVPCRQRQKPAGPSTEWEIKVDW